MVPYDVPHVAHDMMLRFMDVNFTYIHEGTANIPSSIGSTPAGAKPLYLPAASLTSITAVPQGKTPEQEKAMWEAYYNAGSAALVLILIVGAVGAWMWIRKRKNAGLKLPTSFSAARDEEEHIPLNPSEMESGLGSARSLNGSGRARTGSIKGKERAVESEAIFEVGSDDEDDDDPERTRRAH